MRKDVAEEAFTTYVQHEKTQGPFSSMSLETKLFVMMLKAKRVYLVNIKKHVDSWLLHNLARSAANGDCERVKTFCEAGAQVNGKDKKGNTPLNLAVFGKHESAAEYLITKARADVNIANKYKNTALHLSAEEGLLETVKLLHTYGAVTDKRGSDGETALHKAINRGHDSTAAYMIREAKADVNIDSDKKDTALHLLVERGQLDIVKLIDVDSLDANQQGSYSETALHKAIKGGHESTAEYLIREAKVKISRVNNNENTALHLAAKNGHLEAVKLLHTLGADIDKRGSYGETALHLAILRGHKSTAEYLITEAKADINQLINKHDTMLHLAAEKGLFDTVKLLHILGAEIDKRIQW